MKVKVELTNSQRVFNLSQDQRDTIKRSLTFDNPQYAQAKRYGRSKYTSIPPHLYYFKEVSVSNGDGTRSKVLDIPIGVNLSELLNTEIEFKDGRTLNQVNYPKFNLELRKDQQRAENDYLKCRDKVYTKNLVQLPTGKGKSILALHLAQKLKQKTLVLVHKDDLVVGWTKDIKLCFGEDIEVGLIKAKKRLVGEQITIATVQTLSRMSEEELSHYTNQFGLVVQDEVHHIGLKIFNIIDKFNSYYKLGLSATPTRSDGLDFVFDIFMGGLCHKYVYDPTDTDILKVKVIVKNSKFKYKPFLHKGMIYNYYDFDPKELPTNPNFLKDIPYKERPTVPFLTIDNAIVTSREHKIMVCKDIINEYRQGHSCIALFTQKEHINLYYKYLCRYIPKDQIMLYYGDSKEKSEDMMKKAENKEVLVTLGTYAKATEGTNVKSWEVEFLVSSINNEKNVEQATGRIRRSKKGKLDPVIVYDYMCKDCYSVSSHINTRLSVYNRLQYDVIGVPKLNNSILSIGYNR